MTALLITIGATLVVLALVWTWAACALAGDIDQAYEDEYGVEKARRS